MISNIKMLLTFGTLFLWLFAMPLDADAKKRRKKKANDEAEMVFDEEEAAPARQEVDAESIPMTASEESMGYGYDDEVVGEELDKEAQPRVGKVTASFRNKLVLQTDDGWFKFQPTFLFQPRFELSVTPNNHKQNPPSDSIWEGSGFSLKRARFGFKVAMFDWLRVKLDSDWGKDARSRLVDFYADLDAFDGNAVLRVGYHKPWLGRQFLGSSSKYQFVEDAQAWKDQNLGANLARDLGLSMHGFTAGGWLEYSAGFWNGDSIWGTGGDSDNNIPGNIDFSVGGRLAIHPLVISGKGRALPLGDESAWGSYQKPALAIGGSGLFNSTHDNLISISGFDQVYYAKSGKLGLDVAFQYMGWSILTEGFLIMHRVADDAPDAVKNAVRSFGEVNGINTDHNGIGAYGQVGYFVIKEALEVAARFDYVDENIELRGMRFYPAAAATWYFFGNNLKLQGMYRLNVQGGYDKTDEAWFPSSHELFVMLQAAI